MTEFMLQASAFNRFINILSDRLDVISDRMDVVKKAISEYDFGGSASEDTKKSLASIGIQIPTDDNKAYKLLRDELKILVYMSQLISEEKKTFEMLFTPFYGND